MATGTATSSSSTSTRATQGARPGRQLLSNAVSAIQGGRWEDLSQMMQRHSGELETARTRLETRANGHDKASRQSSSAGKTSISVERKAARGGPSKKAGNSESESSSFWQCFTPSQMSFSTLRSFADKYPKVAMILSQLPVLLVYSAGFWYEGYKMDDLVAISRNPNVVSEVFSWDDLMTRDYWGLPMHGAGWTNKSFRPLTTLTFRWNYLLHGLNSSGFFVTNILLHCFASITVGQTAISMTGLSGFWASVCALFFGLHPAHTENVLYLVGRADVLATIFGCLGLCLYAELYRPAKALQKGVEGEDPPRGWTKRIFWMPLPLGLIVVSGMCKEVSLTLFALPILIELLDLLDGVFEEKVKNAAAKLTNRFWGPQKARRQRLIALLVSTFVTFWARYRHTGGTTLNMSPQDNPISFESSWWVRCLSYFYLHGVYVRLMCWPQFLCYDYSLDAIPVVQSLLDCRLLLPWAAYVLVFGALTVVLRAPRRYRHAGLMALAILVVTFLPASNILFPVGTVIGERLVYTPSVGYCLLVICLVQKLLEGGSALKNQPLMKEEVAEATSPTASEREQPAQISIRRPTAGTLYRPWTLLWSALALLGARTWVRVGDWESSETLFIRDGERQKRSSKVQFNLGIIHMQEQNWDEAVEALLRCAWADPLSSLPFYRIGQVEILRGRYDVAEAYLTASLDKFAASLMVPDEEVFHDVAVAMFQNGKVNQAAMRLRVALQINPQFGKGWNNLACCLASQNPTDAVRALQRAVTVAPQHPQYWANLAILAQHTGDPATASSAWHRAQELWPGMPEPRDCTWEFAPAS